MAQYEDRKPVAPYGRWPSPILPAFMTRDLKLIDSAWDESGALVWLERRPDRAALVVDFQDGQAARDLNGGFSARGGVGYGGGDFTVANGLVYFVEAKSGRIYRQPLDGSDLARPITPAFGACAAPVLSPDGRWLVFIRSYEGRDSLEIVDADGNLWPQRLAFGDDFYMQPQWSPDGKSLVWIAWNHPNMPWDGTRLMMAELSPGSGGLPAVEAVYEVAGGEQVAIFQPQFSPDGRYLAYVSDESGWWQIMLRNQDGIVRQLTHAPAEHGEPAWVQGRRTYAFATGAQPAIYFLRNQNNRVGLWQIDTESGQEQEILLGEQYGYLEQISVSRFGLSVIASGSSTPGRLLACELQTDGSAGPARIVRRAGSEELAAQWFSQPEPVEWCSQNGESVYGLYYPPHNLHVRGDGAPPLIVSVHGGPTGQVFESYDLETQFFTSRGYAVLAVNFRGSAGYGRAYRNLLRGSWGVVEVEDAVDGARAMADAGRADSGKLVIMGGSSGGLAVLSALENYPGLFKAGICRYGVSNQFALAMDTHKFELHYADSLLGPLPQAAEIYRQRSPAYFADRIRDALALFQGEDDTVVPRAQSDEVAAVLRRRGVPHVYHVYAGEGHGFRKPETLEHYYRSVERFLLEHVIWA